MNLTWLWITWSLVSSVLLGVGNEWELLEIFFSSQEENMTDDVDFPYSSNHVLRAWLKNGFPCFNNNPRKFRFSLVSGCRCLFWRSKHMAEVKIFFHFCFVFLEYQHWRIYIDMAKWKLSVVGFITVGFKRFLFLSPCLIITLRCGNREMNNMTVPGYMTAGHILKPLFHWFYLNVYENVFTY